VEVATHDLKRVWAFEIAKNGLHDDS